MSQPENKTSGRYYLRTGKPLQNIPASSSIVGASSLLPSFLSPLLAPPSPLRHLSPAPPADPDDASSSPPSPSPSLSLDRDSEDEDMASNSLTPAPFTGRQQEDVLEFLKNYELWVTFRRMSEEAKVAALALLLKEGAAAWYNTQSLDTRNDYTLLKDALIDRYGPAPSDAWKRAAELWQMRQLPNQSIDDFLTATQQAAHKLGVTAEETFMVALNGLRSSIRQHVIQHDPTTIDDIRRWGRLTKVSQQAGQDAERSLQDAVKELTAVKEELI